MRNRIFRAALAHHLTPLIVIAILIVRNDETWAFNLPIGPPRHNDRIHSNLFAAPVDGDSTLVDGTLSTSPLDETANEVVPPQNKNGLFLDATTTKELQKADISQKKEAAMVLDESISIFEIVAGRAATCLVESDLRKNAKEEYSNVISSGATNWIDDATAFALQKAFDRIQLKVRIVGHRRTEGIRLSILEYAVDSTNLTQTCVFVCLFVTYVLYYSSRKNERGWIGTKRLPGFGG
jgi:hypothetical protein